MLNKLGLYDHGEERTQRTVVNNGKTVYERRDKFCVECGWIDVFGIGGDLAWQRQHGKCQPLVSLKPELKAA